MVQASQGTLLGRADAEFWIGFIDQALPLVGEANPDRPCEYSRWTAALDKAREAIERWPQSGEYDWPDNPNPPRLPTDLMSFARGVSKPGWPDDHAHLVEFSLRFLEADVMLFRSGYLKRHLLDGFGARGWTTRRLNAL